MPRVLQCMKLTKVMYYINRIWRGKPYTIIFIDAEKAFDKIRDENSQQTMNRWELPPHKRAHPMCVHLPHPTWKWGIRHYVPGFLVQCLNPRMGQCVTDSVLTRPCDGNESRSTGIFLLQT